MKWQSALAIYFLFWSFCAFLVLPFEARTTEEAGGVVVPGQAESAPHTFDARRVAIRTTVLATLVFTAFYLNYVNDWITTADLDWVR
jgi:predicted secreted protein